MTEPHARRPLAPEDAPAGSDRVLTVPNALSVVRLLLVPVFLYLLLVAHANGWAVGVLMFSGLPTGRTARSRGWPTSRRGWGNCSTLPSTGSTCWRSPSRSAPPASCRGGSLSPWSPATRAGGDAADAAYSRLTALPVTYIGKGATFALMSAFPLILLGQWDALWSRVILACGWAFLIWGMALYLWSGVLYLIQVAMVLRQMPTARRTPMSRLREEQRTPMSACAKSRGHR